MPDKSIEQKIEDMQVAIGRPGNRAAVASAFLEDESVRLAAEKDARTYVLKKEEEESGMAPWMWYTLYFLLGMLFALVIPSTITDLITFFKGGI